MNPRKKIFISYAPDDQHWLERLHTHLKPLDTQIDYWDNTKIAPGAVWQTEIEAAIDEAQIAILLVSSNYLAEDSILYTELPKILKRVSHNELKIRWIAVSPSDYEDTELNNYQPANKADEPLDSKSEYEQNEILVKFCREIKDALNKEEELTLASPKDSPIQPDIPKTQLPANKNANGDAPEREEAIIDDPIEYGKVPLAAEKFRRFSILINEEQKKFENWLQSRDLELTNSEISEALREKNTTEIRNHFTQVMRNLEPEIFNFLQSVDLPVITHLVTNTTNQIPIIQRALEELLHNTYSDFEFFSHGHTGWLFRATKNNPKKDFVIKFLKIKSTNDLPSEDEIDQIISLAHANIIDIVDWNFKHFPAYAVLEYVHGITLDYALKTFGGFPLEYALKTMRQIVDALYHIRQKNILHTNLRPSKIFIDEDGYVKISPLDILKYENDDYRSLSRFKEESQYLSPEVLDMNLDTSNKKDVERSDQFSLGLLLLEMIGGKPLFQANTLSGIFEKRRQFYKNPSKFLDEALPNHYCSKSLKDLIRKMLAKNPEDPKVYYPNISDSLKDPNVRYQNLSVVLKTLEKISSQELSDSPLLNSFNTCYDQNNDLIAVFYQRFFAKYPNVDMKSHFNSHKRQNLMLRFGINIVFEIEHKRSFLEDILNSKQHKNFLDVSIFKTFLETLRDTVRDLLGDEWDEQTMLPAWDDKIQKTLEVVEYTLAGHSEPGEESDQG